MSYFYAGKWLVEAIPILDRLDWCFPDSDTESADQHMRETQNVEELNILPEEMDLLPEEIQDGCEAWTQITFSTDDAFYKEAAPDLGGWYNVAAVLDTEGFYLLLVEEC